MYKSYKYRIQKCFYHLLLASKSQCNDPLTYQVLDSEDTSARGLLSGFTIKPASGVRADAE